ncbi:MAG: family 20 glycosylhydrolase, partial [Saprospiraceae bacterium]
TTATGYEFPILTSEDPPAIGDFVLKTDGALVGNDEAHQLEITEDNVQISGKTPAGIFRALQTVRQLLPPLIESTETIDTTWEIASGLIYDNPTFAYRGAMLDVARHFFPVETVKRYIDHLTMVKMNVLHLHLADDQGWRIEIKSRPKLTEIGGSTEVGGGEGGFYTQEQYRDIVQYAADRFITIVPEIDMPGHTNAALASYAELNCDGKARKLYTGMKVGFSTFCVKSETTYEFIQDVLGELAEMTPGPYLHIGGDESDATRPSDYVYFIERVAKIVDSLDKQLMGWDDVVAADLPTNAVAQHWRSEENAAAAVEQNLQIVLSPAKKAYLDMKYDSTTQLGLTWAGEIEVDTGYQWSPVTYMESIPVENILGVEAPLWGETIQSLDDIEYLLFPRIMGYAEIGWTPDSLRQWTDYRARLGAQAERLDILDVNYYRSPKVDWAIQPIEETDK